MSAVALRTRAWFRTGWPSVLVVAVLIGAVAGAAMGLVAGARRTSSAPDRYTAAHGGDPDVELFQPYGSPLTEQLMGLPGVERVQAVTFVTAFLIDSRGGRDETPNPFAGDGEIFGARIVAGRFADPAVAGEFTVNAIYADRINARVGDRFDAVAFDQAQIEANDFAAEAGPAVGPFPVKLVGITERPSEFDDPSPTMMFSIATAAAHPGIGRVASIYDLHLAPGTDVDALVNAVRRLPGGTDVSVEASRIVSDDARRAVNFQTIALWLVAAIAVIGGSLVVFQLTVRVTTPTDAERGSLRAIGWLDRTWLGVAMIQAAAMAVVAVPLAVVAMLVVSRQFPIGTLATFEPRRGYRLDAPVAVLGSLTMTAVAGLAGVLVAVRDRIGSRRREVEDAARYRRGSFAGSISAGMPLTIGAALLTDGTTTGRRGMGAIALGSVGVSILVAAVVVGVDLRDAIDDEARWGRNYDVLFGNPFLAATSDLAEPFVSSPALSDVSAATIDSVSLDGRDTAVFAFERRRGDVTPVVIDGRLPAADDEIGLGAEVARRLGRSIGDTVRAIGAGGAGGSSADLRVVGVVATPDEAGNGATMTFAALAAIQPSATRNLVLVKLSDDAESDATQTLSEITYTPPETLTTPTSIRAIERVVPAPFVLVGVLIALLVLACGYRITASTRSRRYDLIVLRALGADARQLFTSVLWHATLLTTLAALVGIPLGLAIGRNVVHRLTDALGIVGDAALHGWLMLAGALAALVVANLMALLPAWRAARFRATDLAERA